MPLTDKERAFIAKATLQGHSPESIQAFINNKRTGIPTESNPTTLEYDSSAPLSADTAPVQRGPQDIGGLGVDLRTADGAPENPMAGMFTPVELAKAAATTAAVSAVPTGGMSILGGISLRALVAALTQGAGSAAQQVVEGTDDASKDFSWGRTGGEALAAGLGQAIPEAGMAAFARGGGVGPKTIADTLNAGYREKVGQGSFEALGGRQLADNAELMASRKAIGAAGGVEARIPQLAQREPLPGVSDELGLQLQRQHLNAQTEDAARLVKKQARYQQDAALEKFDLDNEAALRTANEQQIADLDALRGRVRAKMDDSSATKAAESTRAKVQKKVQERAIKEVRVKGGYEVGSGINSALSNAESKLTGDRLAKVQLLKDASDAGVTIDATPLIDMARNLKDTLSKMRGNIETNRHLDSLLATIEAKYSKPGGYAGLETSYSLTPLEADELMHLIRNNVKNAFGKEGGSSEMQQAFLQLSHAWKETFYGTLEDAGKMSAGTRRALVAQENLRDFIDPKTPSGFADALVRSDVGSQERWKALREFEFANGGTRDLENSVTDLHNAINKGNVHATEAFEKAKGEALARYQMDKRAASDLLKSEKDAGVLRIGNMREEANVRRMNLEKTHKAAVEQADTQALEIERAGREQTTRTMFESENNLKVTRALQRGNKEEAMRLQVVGPKEAELFNATNNFFKAINSNEPETIVRKLHGAMTGEGDRVAGQTLLESLDKLEEVAGTRGRIKDEIRRIAQRRDWTQIPPGITGWIQGLQRIARGGAKIALVSGRAPVAAASIIGSRTMEPTKKVKARENAQ